MKKFFAEFKEFAMRGNVMDMAVGVIIGTAFGKITTSLVNDVFMPLIGLLIGGVDLGQLNIVLKPEVLDEAGQVVTEAVTLGIGTFLSTVIDFVLVAFVIFLMVKTINAAAQAGQKGRGAAGGGRTGSHQRGAADRDPRPAERAAK